MSHKKHSFHLLSYFIFLITLILLSFFYTFLTSYNLRNFLGEKLFLKYHQNDLAIFILNSPSPESAYTYYLLGRIYFVNNKLINSLNSFNKSINLNPNFKEAYYGRGLTYGFMGEKYLTQAENDFSKYIELDNVPGAAGDVVHAYGAWAGYNDLAWIHFLKGDFIKQEAVARAGLKISMSNAWLANMLGVALLAQQKCAEAVSYLENAKELLENKSEVKFGEAYSGDNSIFWKDGLENMKKVIGDNLKLCEK